MSPIAENFQRVTERMRTAAARVKRPLQDITLVAVTKLVAPAQIQEALELGLWHLGENRVQEASTKIPLLASSVKSHVCWHMIGRLQSNKVNKAAQLFDRIDSLDRWEIIRMLDDRLTMGQAQAQDRPGKFLDVLIEVKLSPEATKSGVHQDELYHFLERWHTIQRLRLEGLMTMAPGTQDEGLTRGIFSRLRELMAQINSKGIGPNPLRVLSMGMSSDFEIAIEEGSTEVRIGQAIFGERRTA